MINKLKRLKINKKVSLFVGIATFFLLGLGILLGLWSAREMREMVVDQFNEQQLIIARHISGHIERQVHYLKKEILFLKRQIGCGHPTLKDTQEAIRQAFYRMLESGVWKIEMIEPGSRESYVFLPHQQWSRREVTEAQMLVLPSANMLEEQDVWISETQLKPFGMGLFFAASLPGTPKRLLVLDLNMSWFLSPFLSDIRSGKTGYAWLMDEKGHFLYHPNVEFFGKNALEVREEKYPEVPSGAIQAIQKEKMLQGEVGTGFYYSGWHRGITGLITKLIAYCPVVIPANPLRKWSVAVVAPIYEIEDAVRRGYLRQFFLQAMVILVVLLGAGALLFFERRWSRVLEERVNQRTLELKKSEEKYRSLVESAEDFIFTLDSEGKFQSMNSFTANFFGGPVERFLGKDLDSIFPPKVAEEQRTLVKLVFSQGKSVRDEFEIEVGEHKTWISANFMPLKNEKGMVNAVLCIARDITENKNLERQLINAEKLASLGTLAAGVAHEVNNPLGVILGFCDLLLRKAENGSQAYEDLKTIERQGLHCKQVVENLLSFARLGEAKSEYSDVNECIEDIIKVVRHTLEMKGIELLLSLTENLPLVKGDSRQLQQVFLNLVNNAISAMPTGGTLKIRSFPEKPGRKVVVQFEDDGIGIKEEDMDHIYEPFFTTKPEGEGTGLGLFVSYGIITKYGGAVDCVSHHDTSLRPRGTLFTIRFLTKA